MDTRYLKVTYFTLLYFKVPYFTLCLSCSSVQWISINTNTTSPDLSVKSYSYFSYNQARRLWKRRKKKHVFDCDPRLTLRISADEPISSEHVLVLKSRFRWLLKLSSILWSARMLFGRTSNLQIFYLPPGLDSELRIYALLFPSLPDRTNLVSIYFRLTGARMAISGNNINEICSRRGAPKRQWMCTGKTDRGTRIDRHAQYPPQGHFKIIDYLK